MLFLNGYSLTEVKNIFFTGDCKNNEKYNPPPCGNIGGIYNYLNIFKLVIMYIYSIFVIQEEYIVDSKNKINERIKIKDKIACTFCNMFNFEICHYIILQFFIIFGAILLFAINYIIACVIQSIILLFTYKIYFIEIYKILSLIPIIIIICVIIWNILLFIIFISSSTIGNILIVIFSYMEELKLSNRNIQYNIIYYFLKLIGYILITLSIILITPIFILSSLIIIPYWFIYCSFIYFYIEDVYKNKDNGNENNIV